MEKLTYEQKHVLKLIDRDKDSMGWSLVSMQLFPVIRFSIPAELIVLEKTETVGRVKLTEMGKNVLLSMTYL